jgi:three-Cys-motif partner protein
VEGKSMSIEGDSFVRPSFPADGSIPWVIQEQTKIKHILLKKYIDPWMKILLQSQHNFNKSEMLIYFDGFSGPGLYWKDERKIIKCLGSPLIVANIAKKYLAGNSNRKIMIFCVDRDLDSVKILDFYLNRFNYKYHQNWKVIHNEFDTTVNSLLDKFEKSNFSNPPIFFFIDPFGYSGFPMATLKRILQYPQVELFINFMISDINRRIPDKQFEKNFLELFGTDEFKAASSLIKPEDRISFLKNLYCRQLTCAAGAKFVMPFRINTPEQSGRAKYFLIHVSNNYTAFKLMKDIMAKHSHQQFNFEAIGVIGNQESLFEEPEKITLREKILHLIKQSPRPNCEYSTIEKWAYVNTCGCEKTVKDVLIDLEKCERIKIDRRPRQRKNTVTDGALISYIDQHNE